MTAEEEVIALRAEVASLKEQLAQALALIAKLQADLEHLRANPPPSIKRNTSKSTNEDKGKAANKDSKDSKPRRKRAKDQNGARRREQTPTRTVEHRLEKCPDCGYSLPYSTLACRGQVIELPVVCKNASMRRYGVMQLDHKRYSSRGLCRPARLGSELDHP